MYQPQGLELVWVLKVVPVLGSPQCSWCLEHSAGPPVGQHRSALAQQTPVGNAPDPGFSSYAITRITAEYQGK